MTQQVSAVGTNLSQMVDQIKESIQPQIESIFNDNVQGIVEQITSQFEEKLKARGNNAGNNAGGATLQLGNLFNPQMIDSAIQLISAWKQPSGNEQLMGIFRTFIQGMTFGQKIKTGEMTPEDMEKALGIATGQSG